MSGKIVLYTVVTGNYDNVNNIPSYIDRECVDFFCITDFDFIGNIPIGWHQIKVPPSKLSNKDLSRLYKIKPHEIFPQYEWSIYIDANIELISNIDKLIYGMGDDLIGLYEHPIRKNCYDEGYECIKQGHDVFYTVLRQLKKYKNQGLKENEFYENNIIVRKHNNKIIKDAMNLWWDEYINGGRRDQYSLTYALYSFGVIAKNLGKHDARFLNNFFKYNPHNPNKKVSLKRKIIRKMNHIMMKLI